MPVQDVSQQAAKDFFESLTGLPADQLQGTPGQPPVRFANEQVNLDLFATPQKQEGSTTTTDQTTVASTTTTDQTTQSSTTTTGETTKPSTDIIAEGAPARKVETKVEELTGLSDYFQQRMKEGKLVAVNEVDEKGNATAFIPKTAEDFDKVLEAQVEYAVKQATIDIDKQWYDSKPPVWKAVAQYAEMLDDPADLIPFLQGARTIQTVANLNAEEIDGAEQIVRVRLEQRGDPVEVINSQIEALKTTNQLINTAKQIKPIVVQQEQAQMAEMVQAKEKQEFQWKQLVSDIAQKAYETVKQPIFGKQKMKEDEQAAVYHLIGAPANDGYALYEEIDRLYQQRDMAKLAKIALLLAKEESFNTYFGNEVAQKTAVNLQKKIQVAAETHNSTANTYEGDKVTTIQRNSFNNKSPRFGRG